MKPTGSGGTEESTEESTDGEDRDDQRLGGRGDVETAGVSGTGVSELPEPGIHFLDSTDHTSVITEEDTTKGAECDHEDTNELALESVKTLIRGRGGG